MTLKSFNDSSADEARQFLLDRRNERKHPKRHRTLGRRKRLAKEKKEKAKAKAARNVAAKREYVALVRKYWIGESDNHPA